ncbi:hypothetical protein ACFL08_02715 [Patescibacteria group bacterium]
MIDKRGEYLLSLKGFFTNPILVSMLSLSVVVNLAVSAALYFFIGTSGQSIILHYNAYFGVDLVGSWWQIYLMPVAGFFFIIVNLILASYFFYKKERIAAHVLMLTVFMVQLGVVIATISAIMINY